MAATTSATPVTTPSSSARTGPNVDFVLPELYENHEKYELIRDCLAGQEAVKKKAQKYLPMPNAHDKSADNVARYEAYLARGLFYNVTGNTIAGLVGQVFSSDPATEFPEQLDPMWDDVTGEGVSMAQQAKRTLGHVLAYGRCGLLTDFPKAKADGTDFTREEVQNGTARPVIQFYGVEDIPNWRYKTVGAESILCLVVLNEQYIISDDGFEIKRGRSKRVLRLDGDNLYVMEEWRPIGDDPENGWQKMPDVMPTDANGKRLNYIPFTFVGSQNNDGSVDRPPMYDMACINIAHYRNSCDYEDSVYMVGQPTPYFSGLSKAWVDDVLKGTIYLGSRGAVPLPEGGEAGLIQAEENSMVKEAMDKKEQQMIAIGAQLVEDKQVQRTLGEAKMQNAVISSTLSSCANNVSQAFQQSVMWACDFYGVPNTDVVFELSTDFAIQKMSPQDRSALLAEWQGGGISWSEYRMQLRQSGIATQDDDEAKEEIAGDEQDRIDMNAKNGLDATGKPIPTDPADDEGGDE
jgi:hypothetical protein